MSDQEAAPQEKPAKRGEAAWKATKDDIAARNEAVSKAGRAKRESFERQKDVWRREIDVKRAADVAKGRGAR